MRANIVSEAVHDEGGQEGEKKAVKRCHTVGHTDGTYLYWEVQCVGKYLKKQRQIIISEY